MNTGNSIQTAVGQFEGTKFYKLELGRKIEGIVRGECSPEGELGVPPE
jgi:hypothetical protein